jgi:hypothetical protein
MRYNLSEYLEAVQFRFGMSAMAVMNITSAWYSGIQQCRSDMGPQAFGVGCRRTNVGGWPHDDLYIVISNGLRPGCVPGVWRSVADPGTASMRLQALTIASTFLSNAHVANFYSLRRPLS